MEGFSYVVGVKVDLNFLLRIVKVFDIEGFDKVNFDISKWWFFFYFEFWKWWWRRCYIWFFFKFAVYNIFV